nr:MAG TPA: hypothetical protein [Caudoviricetes sp.]
MFIILEILLRFIFTVQKYINNSIYKNSRTENL